MLLLKAPSDTVVMQNVRSHAFSLVAIAETNKATGRRRAHYLWITGTLWTVSRRVALSGYVLSPAPISIGRMSSLLVLVAAAAAIGALLVLALAAVSKWLDLEQADFCVGLKGVSVSVRRGSNPPPDPRKKRSGRGTR